jgi:type I restriction enzyme M protein
MGLIFENLIRRFNELANETAGDHFTPREVIRLMVNLLLSRDREALARNQEDLVRTVFSLPSTPFNDREKFLAALDSATKSAGIKLSAPLRKAALSALSERDEAAEICRDDEGNPEPDPDLRDTENVPLGESVQAFFDREVKPHVPDAWINRAILDHKDGRVGKVGYEINFNRYFYKYQPPRPLEEIESDIKTIEKDILAMLRDAAG